MSKKVVTRFAPSPTGDLHVGGVRTALFSYLYARQNDGKFILRIEDTDKERSKKEFEEGILESMKWLSLEYDELYRQSERTEIYKNYLQQLIDNDHAYISKEDLEDPKTAEGAVKKGEGNTVLRDSVIRFKNPNKKVTFNDLVLGEVTMDTSDLGDFVIAKNMDMPLYNFVVVVDDETMGVTHIIRGQDHLSNTPRQILIGEALGFERSQYAHIPLILSPDKAKLSKRHGALSALEYREAGYLPQALLNFLGLIGWNPGDDREIFTLPDLVKEFGLEKVQKGGGVFNVAKLDWMNREHIKILPLDIAVRRIEDELPEYIKNKKEYSRERFLKLIPMIIERISKWSDVGLMAEEGEIGYFFETPEYDAEDLVWKKSDISKTKTYLEELQNLIEGVEGEFSYKTVKSAVWDYAEKEGRGDVLWPMRFALSGRQKSPDPFELAAVFGKEETLKRLEIAHTKLKEA